jgi:hypothetical protein
MLAGIYLLRLEGAVRAAKEAANSYWGVIPKKGYVTQAGAAWATTNRWVCAEARCARFAC